MTEMPPLNIIQRHFDAVYPSFAMLAGIELDVFTSLDDGPLTVEELAGAIGLQAVKLQPLLYALVEAGLLMVEDGLFSNTQEAGHYLVKGKPDYLGGMHDLTSDTWNRLLTTAMTIRAGTPQITHDFLSLTPDEQMGYFRGLFPGAVSGAQRLLENYDFSKTETLADIGGGSGGLAITMAKALPQLRATVIDLSSVTPITRRFVEEAGASERVDILSANAVEDSLSGVYDVVVASHLVQVLSVDEARALLRNLSSVIKPGGVLYIVGWVLDNTRLSPDRIVYRNLVLLTYYDNGQAYTEREYYDWFQEAGLVDYERKTFPDGVSILTARKSQ